MTLNKIHINLLIILCLVLVIGCSKSSDDNPTPVTPTFSNTLDNVVVFGGTKNEEALALTNTKDGGFAVAGYTQSNDGDITNKPNEGFDVLVLKYNTNTVLQWQKTYGGTQNDRANDVIQTNDGGLAVLGFTASNDNDVNTNAGFDDYWLLKLDALGNLQWQKTFGYGGSDSGFSIKQTTDNGYILVGVLDVTASNGQGNSKVLNAKHAGGDYWAIKLDANGNEQWRKYFGGTFTDTPYDVIETNNNAFIIVGSSDSTDVDIKNNKGTYDFWVVKISNEGTLIWEQSYGGSQIDEASAIAKTDDGNFLIVGDTRSDDTDITLNKGGADIWLIKIDPNGNLIWQKTLGGSDFDSARSLKKADNGYLIAGSSRSTDGDFTNNKGQNDALILKIDQDANIVWQHTIGGTEIDLAYNAIELQDGSVVGVGKSDSANGDIKINKGFSDILIFKLK